MRSKGSRFTLGVWGLRVCSLDVAFTPCLHAVAVRIPLASCCKALRCWKAILLGCRWQFDTFFRYIVDFRIILSSALISPHMVGHRFADNFAIVCWYFWNFGTFGQWPHASSTRWTWLCAPAKAETRTATSGRPEKQKRLSNGLRGLSGPKEIGNRHLKGP